MCSRTPLAMPACRSQQPPATAACQPPRRKEEAILVKQTSSAWSSLGGRTRSCRRSSGSSKRTKSLVDKVKHVARSSEHARPTQGLNVTQCVRSDPKHTKQPLTCMQVFDLQGQPSNHVKTMLDFCHLPERIKFKPHIYLKLKLPYGVLGFWGFGVLGVDLGFRV